MIRRVYIEKKTEFNHEAHALLQDLQQNLGIKGLEKVRVLVRYDVEGLTEEEFSLAVQQVLAEPQVDSIFLENAPTSANEKVFAIEFLPGQFDQRADSAAQCIQILTQKQRPALAVAKLIALKGALSENTLEQIKNYCINAVDSREASLDRPQTLTPKIEAPRDVALIDNFIHKSSDELKAVGQELGLAMSQADIAFCQQYFAQEEGRDPSLTEIKMLDTYWSDHCRHTTFMAAIDSVTFEAGASNQPVKNAYENYLKSRSLVYGDEALSRPITLMDIAVIAAKEMRKTGKLDDLEISEEINACSIIVPVDIDGKTEEWLVMFKNETHNHPTEIEPFGGAATCLGGAIRDPLSGRSYVYQAMRVTGSADPRKAIQETLPGKLPQRTITLEAARGYSSYGNQIGLATGQVTEIYHPGYEAKRMEIGAVIAAAPRKNVQRGEPTKGDLIVLVGGRTGRDGVGGATGSSKEHTEGALENSAEVQKGDPPMERKLQRLFRIPEVAQMIIRCNDFGAGGVSVAIGELAPSLEIYLDNVTKKYEGLDGTELAISESQERMAVVIKPADLKSFLSYAAQENLEAKHVADVTDSGRLEMKWRGKTIVSLSREFLDSNGVSQSANVHVTAPAMEESPWAATPSEHSDIKQSWLNNLQDLNRCSQKGLNERFDSTIGAGSVLHPWGGKYRATPTESMAAKIPLIEGETTTATLMSHGFNPYISQWSPFHGAVYAVVESIARIVASGGDYSKIRLTLQEYFEKLHDNPTRWGKPFAALLGAHWVQSQLDLAAIGGKDSMSGSFNEMDVPPTLVSFAMAACDARTVLSPEFKETGTTVVQFKLLKDEQFLPDFENLKTHYDTIHQLAVEGKINAAQSIRSGGLAEAISKMAFGNRIGFAFSDTVDQAALFAKDYGSIIVELKTGTEIPQGAQIIGSTQMTPSITVGNTRITIIEAQAAWEAPLESVFPTQVNTPPQTFVQSPTHKTALKRRTSTPIAKPRVFIPVFPGTNCEYDTVRAFENAGAITHTFIFQNLTGSAVEHSLDAIEKNINNAQILMLPGGFSAGDEPDGSGKFIAAVFRNEKIRAATMRLLNERDGLILGICNGFQALIKLGLVPFGEIRDLSPEDPTLTFNDIGRHVSCYVKTKTVSHLSPWLSAIEPGEVHTIPVSHGEGKFYASEAVLKSLAHHGQIATQYVDEDNQPTMDIKHNPNGSLMAIEGITSPDGKILGKMGHTERAGPCVGTNIDGNKDQPLFQGGVHYFQ